MKSIQKKIKFSKGMINPQLVERTDLSLYDSSAKWIQNCVSTVYGGLRSRDGTKLIDELQYVSGNYYSEISGSATTDLGGDATKINNLEMYVSNTINNNKLVAKICLEREQSGNSEIRIKNIALTGNKTLAEYTGGDSATLNLPAGEYAVNLVGCGGGWYSDSDKTAGAGGAAIRCDVSLSSGPYTLSLGDRGDIGNGAASTFSGNNLLLSAGGGYYGGIGYSIPKGGEVTITNPNNIPISFIQKQNGNTPTNNKGGASVYNGYGRGTDAYNLLLPYQANTGGYANLVLKDTIMDIQVLVSTDDVSYTPVQTVSINTTTQDIGIATDKTYRYVKLVIENTASYPTTLSLQYIKVYGQIVSQSSSNYKLKKFIFNNEQKYLLVLANQQILIYQNDTLQTIVPAIGLTEDILQEVKTTQNEDTMVLSHPNMRTKQLQRTNEGWTWSDFPFQNIPYHAFGGETKTAKTTTLTPSGMEGSVIITSSGEDFSENSVGQYIDGNGGRFKITEYFSATKVGGYTVIPFYTEEAFSAWDYLTGYEAVWSESRGWPATCLFAQQRLWFGGSLSKKSSLWGSRVNLYNDFKNVGNYDNDAINVDLVTTDSIVNIIENRGLHIFTTGQEWTVSENSLTPKTISITKNTQNGSLPNISPVISEGRVLFVERNGNSLLSYIYDYNQSGYVTDNLSLTSDLIQCPVALEVENNSVKDKGDFVYLVLPDGSMLVTCLILNQQINSTTIFKMDGAIKDVCSLLGETYLLVARGEKYFLEKITALATDATVYQVPVAGYINNLDKFIGKSVYIYTPDSSVVNKVEIESATIAVKDSFNQGCYIGIPFEYKIISNPIDISGLTAAIRKRIVSATVYTMNTPVVTFCKQRKKTQENRSHFLGVHPYSYEEYFDIQGSFYPLNLLSLTLSINYEN